MVSAAGLSLEDFQRETVYLLDFRLNLSLQFSMVCIYLRFISCDDNNSTYDVWVCGYGLPETGPIDLGTAKFCALKDLKPCIVEGGPFSVA